MQAGHEIFDRVQKDIDGRLAMLRDEGRLLCESINPDDLYLEVGTLWGGSAILAAHKAQRVITIDPLWSDFWADGDTSLKSRKLSIATILDNFHAFRVAHKISIIKASSNPFPLTDIYPDVFFIDGDHSFEGVRNDWEIASKITKRTILMHDYGNEHEDVTEFVDKYVKNDKTWTITALEGKLLKLKKYALDYGI